MTLRAVVAVGVVVAAIGAAWLIWLLATSANQGTTSRSAPRDVPTSVLPQPTLVPSETPADVPTPTVERPQITVSAPLLFDDDLGTTSTEFSAVALNEDQNTLLVADDEGRLFEFGLDSDGVPMAPPRRTIIVEFGDRDIEGLTWISGELYVLAHETTGLLSLVEIDNDQLVIDQQHVRRTIDTQVREIDGNGIEGVTRVETIDDVEFAAVLEQPPSLILIDDDGVAANPVPLQLGVGDIADIWAAPDGTFWVVSDVNRVVIRVELDATGVVQQLQQIDLVFPSGAFEQPEGIVISRDGERLYVVGEAPGPGRFSLGIWNLS